MVEEGVKNLEKSVDIYKILQNINEVKNRKGQEVAHCTALYKVSNLLVRFPH